MKSAKGADPAEAAMKAQEIQDEWLHLEENDPPPDLSRENAAFERERARLLRDYLGKAALIHGDDVLGPFDNANDAIIEGYRLFGQRTMVRLPDHRARRDGIHRQRGHKSPVLQAARLTLP